MLTRPTPDPNVLPLFRNWRMRTYKVDIVLRNKFIPLEFKFHPNRL
jgi:hypothetical protein